MCTGFHPTKDLTLIRYAYPNNTWYGLGDPLVQRSLNTTTKMDNSTQVTDMYTIDIGNGRIVSLEIDRAVSQNEINTTALAEGILPEAVEIYGPGWKSIYDVDDDEEEHIKSLSRRSQLVNMRPT